MPKQKGPIKKSANEEEKQKQTHPKDHIQLTGILSVYKEVEQKKRV